MATGFAGMAFDLLIIFAFQAFYGYVYQQIGLLVTAFMAGLSLGGLVMTRRVERIYETLWMHRDEIGPGRAFDQPFDYRECTLPAAIDGDNHGQDKANTP